MPPWTLLTDLFNTLREVDLNAIRREAEQPVQIALVAAPGPAREALLSPPDASPGLPPPAPAVVLYEPTLPDLADRLASADLILLLPHNAEVAVAALLTELLSRRWPGRRRSPLLVCAPPTAVGEWPAEVTLFCDLEEPEALSRHLAPAMLARLEGKALAAARRLPLLRERYARDLIAEVAVSNALYALSTGLAEVVPILDLPLNVADVVVLTKNQAMMAYRLALAMGLEADWRQTVPDLAAVVGGGFLWRQVARQLVGLIPVWGLVPKVAVAYAGTYATGQAIYHWCATGRKLETEELKALYQQALAEGRKVASRLIEQAKREDRLRLPRPRLRRGRRCPSCGERNPRDALFCAYCGTSLEGRASS